MISFPVLRNATEGVPYKYTPGVPFWEAPFPLSTTPSLTEGRADDKSAPMVKTYYQGLVQLGKAQGVIDPTLDDELVVFLLSATFNNFGKFILEKNQVNLDELASGNFDYKSIPMEDLTDQIISVLEKGLAQKGSE